MYLPKKWFSNISLFLILSIGLILCILSENLFLIWIALELNMFGVIPLICNRNEKKRKETRVPFYYFFVQVVGRLCFFVGRSLGYYWFGAVGLLIKLGLPPFCQWVPPIIARLDWFSIGLLRGVQKLPGVMLLRILFDVDRNICMFIGCLGLLFSGVGINTSFHKIKKLVGWSSVGNISLLFIILSFRKMIGLLFYIGYRLLIIFFCRLARFSDSDQVTAYWYNFILLVFSGIPPLIGFILKLCFFTNIVRLPLILKEGVFIGHFLDKWNFIILVILLLALQKIGYLKRFIYIKSKMDNQLEIGRGINRYIIMWFFFIGIIFIL